MRADRFEKILNIITQNKSAKVSELSSLLGVTEKTIRQDLTQLEEMNMISRVHGGAILKREMHDIFPVGMRKSKNSSEKERIAFAAASLVEDGDLIILDSGSTILPIVQYIDKNAFVITNDLFIANALLEKPNLTLFMIGGRLNTQQNTSPNFIGKSTVNAILNYTANKAFIGTSTISFDKGLMIFSDAIMDIKKAMIKISEKVIVLADHSKFNKSAFSTFASLDEIDMIIVDKALTNNEKEILESHNIIVKTV